MAAAMVVDVPLGECRPQETLQRSSSGIVTERRTALLTAFASRFAIGFLIPLVGLPLPAAAAGALVGFLISLPDAILTKAYAPILIIGTAGGALIGWLIT